MYVMYMMYARYPSLSVMPVKTSSCTGFQAAAKAVAEQWAHAGTACNRATVRPEQREENWISLRLLASGSVYARAGRGGHGILLAWPWLGRSREGTASVGLIPPHMLLLNPAPSSLSPFRKGGKRGEKKPKPDRGSQTPSFCMSS